MDQTIPSKMFQKVAIFMVLLQEGFFFSMQLCLCMFSQCIHGFSY